MSPCFSTGVLVKKSRTWTLEMAHQMATKPEDLSFIPSTIRVTHNHLQTQLQVNQYLWPLKVYKHISHLVKNKTEKNLFLKTRLLNRVNTGMLCKRTKPDLCIGFKVTNKKTIRIERDSKQSPLQCSY